MKLFNSNDVCGCIYHVFINEVQGSVDEKETERKRKKKKKKERQRARAMSYDQWAERPSCSTKIPTDILLRIIAPVRLFIPI